MSDLDHSAPQHTDLDWAAPVRLAADVLIQDLGGEAVLLDLESEQYFGLDDVGTRMLQVLDASESLQVAYGQLLAEYEVEPAMLRQDLQAFVQELQAHGLIIQGD
ncbi:MAG: PqqD family protein [Cyanobacteria bacterium P01_G01_bin.54]